MSDDLSPTTDKTDTLEVSAQLKIMRHDLKMRFDRIEEKLDDHKTATDKKVSELENHQIEDRRDIIEIKAQLREAKAQARILTALGSLLAAVAGALAGKMM